MATEAMRRSAGRSRKLKSRKLKSWMSKSWMSKSWMLALLLALGVAHAGSAQPVAGEHAGRPASDTLATVGRTAITVARFEASYAEWLIRTGRNDTEAARRSHLETMIDTHLLAAEAARRGLDADSTFRADRRMETKKALGARYYEVAFLDSLPPLSDAELRTVYARSRQQVVLRHLLYPTEAEAQSAYDRLRAGADFIDLANDCFDLPAYDSLAGFLGPVGYFDVDDAVAETAFALEAGTFSRPVRSRYGWHLLYVEDWIRNPLLAEDDYLRKRDGLASRYRQHRRRLEGDRFVRAFMEGLDVQARPEALRVLAETIAELEQPAEADAPTAPGLSDGERGPIDVASLREQLTPETVLLSYEWQGERRTFTAWQYYQWVPLLPAAEVRQRTAASVGRALRNELFAEQGEALGLKEDAWVRDEVAYRSRLLLADALRDSLRAHSTAPPDEATVQALAERFGAGYRRTLTADYWYIPFESYEAAEQARDRIADDRIADDRITDERSAAQQYEGYHAFTNADVSARTGWTAPVASAPLGETVVLGREDGTWVVLHVSDRSADYVDVETLRPYLEQALQRYTAEVDLLKRLRAQTPIHRNEARFQAIMDGVDPALP